MEKSIAFNSKTVVILTAVIMFVMGNITGFSFGAVYLKNKIEKEIHTKYESATQSVKDTTVKITGKAKEVLTKENLENAKETSLAFTDKFKDSSEEEDEKEEWLCLN